MQLQLPLSPKVTEEVPGKRKTGSLSRPCVLFFLICYFMQSLKIADNQLNVCCLSIGQA